jgi:hypothetical protein
MMSLKGKSLKAIEAAMRAAVPPESLAVLRQIRGQVRRCTAEDADGWHGFTLWKEALQQGWARLPRTIPHEVLLAWRNGHACAARDSVAPDVYCRHCRMALPAAGPNGSPQTIFRRCPVCGFDDLGREDPRWPGRWRPCYPKKCYSPMFEQE